MLDLFKEVQRIYENVEARKELDERIRQGDLKAAETFFYFALWRGIREDRTYPPMKKPRLFLELIKQVQQNVDLNFEMVKGEPVG
jgi:hypothetical protein